MKRSLRVLLISHTCQSRTEGQPRAERLARMPNVELRVLMPDRWRHWGQWRTAQMPENAPFAWEAGKVAWPWMGPAQGYLHWYPHLADLLKQFQPDIIDIWEEPWGLVSAHACWLRNRLLPAAKIISETEQNVNKPLPFPFERFRAYTLRNAAFAIGRNAEAVEVLRAKGYRGPAEVIPNAVDSMLFRPLNRDACRRELGLSGFVAGYVGRLVEEKGLMDMIDALPLCREDARLLFVGSGPFQASLEQRARDLGRTGQVRFLPSRPQEDLPQVMNALDTLVLVSHTTSRWKEQFGRVIIEAHACQIPVIGSDSGAIPSVVGQGGLVVPERDPAALAAAINEMAANSERGTQLGMIGRGQVEEYYTWERVAARMRHIYLQLSPRAESMDELTRAAVSR